MVYYFQKFLSKDVEGTKISYLIGNCHVFPYLMFNELNKKIFFANEIFNQAK